MRRQERTRRQIETELARALSVGFDTDERLATAASLIAEAEATFRRLAEPRLRE
jgi:hypothetical protein